MLKEGTEVKIQDIQDNMQIQVINILLIKITKIKNKYIYKNIHIMMINLMVLSL